MADYHIKKFKDYNIIYNEFFERFETEEDGEIRGRTIKEVEEKIKRLTKIKYKRTKVFVNHYSSGVVSGVLTSLVGNNNYGWVTDINDTKGRREKINTGNIFKDSVNNRKLVKRINTIKKKIIDLQKEKANLHQQLEKVNVKDVMEE